MESKKEENNLEGMLPALTPEGILSALDGIPLPPVVKKNLWKAIGNLISSAIEIPIAYLESKTQQLKNERDGLTLVTKFASVAAADEFRSDPQLVNRAVNHFGSRLFKEQINREAALNKAIDELKVTPPEKESEKEIDPDWLEMFSRVSETKSNEDVQLFLGKILAGEIKEPGTFGQKTIQTLSLLDQHTAQIFQLFCNISFAFISVDKATCVPYKAFGEPGSNGLASLGLSYTELTTLQDAGLIQQELSAYKEMPNDIFKHVIVTLGSSSFKFQPSEETPEKIKLEAISFTRVGLELRKVIHITSNPLYNEKFVEWIKSEYKIEVAPL